MNWYVNHINIYTAYVFDTFISCYTLIADPLIVRYIQFVYAVAALSDGRIVSGSWDNTIRVWNSATGACITVLEGHTGVRLLSS